MTDNEIIKALECCCDELHYCSVCPYFLQDKENDFCREDMNKDALDLINRQQAEVDNLRKVVIDDYATEYDNKIIAEAIKEISARVYAYKTGIFIKGEELIVIPKSDYDDFVKEMVGDTE